MDKSPWTAPPETPGAAPSLGIGQIEVKHAGGKVVLHFRRPDGVVAIYRIQPDAAVTIVDNIIGAIRAIRAEA